MCVDSPDHHGRRRPCGRRIDRDRVARPLRQAGSGGRDPAGGRGGHRRSGIHRQHGGTEPADRTFGHRGAGRTRSVQPAQLAASLQEELRTLGLHVMVCDTNADRDEERAYLREAVQQRFAGVVITPFRLVAKDFLTLSEAGIPAVFSADLPFGETDLVTPDARAAMRAAPAEVTGAGSRRIAMIAGPPGCHRGRPPAGVVAVPRRPVRHHAPRPPGRAR